MMMKHTKDGTVEGTAKHTAGEIHTHSLSYAHTFTHLDVFQAPPIHTHRVNRVLSAGFAWVLSAREKHVDSIHHT